MTLRRRAPILDPPSPPRLDFLPTAEQEHILRLVHGSQANLLINALAGSGKTATLRLIERSLGGVPILFLAFNKRIVDASVHLTEREWKLRKLPKEPTYAQEAAKRMLPTTNVRTLNSLGHSIWSATCASKILIDKDKCRNLLREIIKSTLHKSDKEEAFDIFYDVLTAVGLAKALGYVPSGAPAHATRLIPRDDFFASLEELPTDLGAELIDRVLVASIQAAYKGNLDFNDQLYMPALFGGSYPQPPVVLVDEAQDLSPINHEMLRHLSRSRIIAVGDPWQSIYGFRGAVQDGMTKLREQFKMSTADLSISFRCPETIVHLVHWRVPHMRWHKSGGFCGHLANPTPDLLADGAAIICRNNAPLFSLALKLLRSGRSVTVAGSDIGLRVINIMRKLGPESLTQAETLYAIESWRQEHLARESKSADDIADCMGVFARAGATLSEGILYAEHLFEQSGTLHLLTGHKAKGLEWETVYHLDPFLIRDDRGDQELNLRYVIQTRALSQYFEIESGQFKWSNP